MPTRNVDSPEEKKKHSGLKYLIYIVIVLVATAISLMISLWGDNFNKVVDAMHSADWGWFGFMMGLVALSYVFEALILLVFCRLFTRKYRFHQAIATSMIGQFYSDVTPGASGGQAMQVYTLKSQGVQVSNSASIMVMSFILYQSSLILFDVVALVVEWDRVLSITVNIEQWGWHLPMWPIIFAGFVLNLAVIALLLTMSYSHHIHNFILHYVVGALGKLRILKNPDRTRESLRVQVENFKIELKHLFYNIPVLVVQVIFYVCILLIRNSIPYFSALAVHAQGPFFEGGFSFINMIHTCFLTSFHQMCTGLIPLPGSAGISELFYSYLFAGLFLGDGVLQSSQILWRTATFHIVLVISGFVAAFYRSRAKEPMPFADHKTFVNLQLETFDERKRNMETLYETRQLSRKEIQRKISAFPKDDYYNETPLTGRIERVKPVKSKKEKPAKAKKTKTKAKENSWETWDI
ncbi:MAG: flippase-like domain-containing protein [Bacilli bacterium]|nr:flippase-like domain-containing protein [Bacilli bacterium]